MLNLPDENHNSLKLSDESRTSLKSSDESQISQLPEDCCPVYIYSSTPPGHRTPSAAATRVRIKPYIPVLHASRGLVRPNLVVLERPSVRAFRQSPLDSSPAICSQTAGIVTFIRGEGLRWPLISHRQFDTGPFATLQLWLARILANLLASLKHGLERELAWLAKPYRGPT